MSSLLVPLQLDVLMVREDGESWARTAMVEPTAAPGTRVRQKLLPDPFQVLPASRPKGAHLYWALPDGLTRGIGKVNGSAEFPPVPDRWLVVRLSGAASPGPRAVRAWLIANVNARTPIVVDALSGAALPPPGESPEKPLTALGFGDLGWAAYYDNVVGRLGLHDPLTDVTSGSIAYLVCGWYTHPALDPIRASTESEFQDRLEQLRWSVARTEGGPYPSMSVYHGSAVSIGWPKPNWAGDGGRLGTELDMRPSPESVEVALGQTVSEALAALTTTSGGAGVARLLEGMYESALTELTHADGTVRLDTTLHVSRFGSRPSAAGSEVIWAPAMAGATAVPVPLASGSVMAPGVGGLHEALAASSPAMALLDPAPADAGTGSFVEVNRSTPRVWNALEPAIVLRGAGRGFKHGGDGRFTTTGHLVCRMEEDTLTEFGVVDGDRGVGAAVLPPGVLAPLAARGAPSACTALLVELACLDPGSAPDLALSTPDTPSPVADARVRWWASWNPKVSLGAALTGVHLEGMLPSPVAVTPPTRPWTPLHLEWSAAYLPSPRGAHDWRLGENDFESPAVTGLPAADPRPLTGRVLLSGAAATALASATATGEDTFTASGTDPQDLLSGALTELTDKLRAEPEGEEIQSPGDDLQGELPLGPRPAGFLALRAGFLRLKQLRLVDGYGQFIELLPGGAPLVMGEGLRVEGHPAVAALVPRFTAPARVLFRYAAATGARADAGPGHSPVCGYLVPAPVDGSLEFFDADGIPRGRLRPDPMTGTAWEEDPGNDAALGAPPSRWLKNPYLAAFADNLLAADTAAAEAASRAQPVPQRTALESLMRVLDITRWSVDPTARAGDEHLALLLGQPVAVLRATLKIEVEDPRLPPENEATAVPVRLGSLGHHEDGLLAYVVGDDYSRVHVVDPAVPALALEDGSSPFIDRSGVFYVNPGTPVPLTLFMVPQTDVNVTTGLLPRKAVGMLRDWTAPALSRMSPAFRYGPVLRHESATRLPVPTDIRGTCQWHWRPDPLTWASEEILPATADAVMSDASARVSEGWVQVALAPDSQYAEQAVPVRITCIRTRRFCGVRQILAVGCHNADGSHLLIPVSQAAAMHESGRFHFFVQRPGHPKNGVEVITTKRGIKYLRTPGDPKGPNALLSLAECGEWTLANRLPFDKLLHKAVLLQEGKVLVVGGYNLATYLYDALNDTWATTGAPSTTRREHTLTSLLDGRVLMVGGASGNMDVTAELYDPVSGTWKRATSMRTARRYHTATLLHSGKVLIAGGSTSTVELYDPANGMWFTLEPMATARSNHTATLLADGRVLVTGGVNLAGERLTKVEVFDPQNGTWSTAAPMKTARRYHSATLLMDGKVLVTGGGASTALSVTAELYDPDSNTWTSTGNMVQPRRYHTATLLKDGKVVVAGGYDDRTGIHTATERYDPAKGTWSDAGPMHVDRYLHSATLLKDGRVLVVSGNSNTDQSSAELFTP